MPEERVPGLVAKIAAIETNQISSRESHKKMLSDLEKLGDGQTQILVSLAEQKIHTLNVLRRLEDSSKQFDTLEYTVNDHGSRLESLETTKSNIAGFSHFFWTALLAFASAFAWVLGHATSVK